MSYWRGRFAASALAQMTPSNFSVFLGHRSAPHSVRRFARPFFRTSVGKGKALDVGYEVEIMLALLAQAPCSEASESVATVQPLRAWDFKAGFG